MKTLPVLISIVITVTAITDNDQWLSYKNEYGKTYETLQEESFRLNIFKENLRKIERHNAKFDMGEETYKMAVNQFTDVTQEELFKKSPLQNIFPKRIARFSANPDIQAEPSVDWRKKGAVLDVGTQGSCYSDWAFSAIGALEGQNAIKHKKKSPLSIQELLDCSRHYGNYGCGGGWLQYAFDYVKDNEISSSADYPYKSKPQFCQNETVPRINLNVTGYTFVDAKEETLRQAVEIIGPISVTINSAYITSYQKGIFSNDNCTAENPDLALLAVGYGTENGTDYWILKNSFGKNWGENGYIRIVRNRNNTCGVASHGIFPNVV